MYTPLPPKPVRRFMAGGVLLLVLAACQPERLPVPSAITAQTPCAAQGLAGFPVYAGGRSDPAHTHRTDATYFICRPDEYALEFDPTTRTARWLIQEFNRAHWSGPSAPRHHDPRPDPKIPLSANTTPSLWVDPYVMLQLAPAAAVDDDEARVGHTMYTSTLLAVDPGLLDASSRLTATIRQWAEQRGPLWVVSGPVFPHAEQIVWLRPPSSTPPNESRSNPQPVASSQIRMAVPAAIYRIVLDPRTGEAIAFVLPNAPLAPDDVRLHAATVEQVEQMTGLIFFPQLRPEQAASIKSSVNPARWPMH